MNRACIAVVDAARARIYTYEEIADDTGAHPPSGALREAIDLVDPGRRGHDQFSTSKPGIRGSGTTDDHRQSHLAELDRRFAHQVMAEILRVTREHGHDRVVVLAGPAMLGALRAVGDGVARQQRAVEYVARDLTQLSSAEIHDHLAQLGLVAPRRVARAG